MRELALTTCWYTRDHMPDRPVRAARGKTHYAQCRYCKRAIFTLDGRHWHLDGGFNIEEVLQDSAPAFLSVEDTIEGMVIARVPIARDASEADIAELRARIEEQYDIRGEGRHLAIRESRRAGRRSARKPQPPAAQAS